MTPRDLLFFLLFRFFFFSWRSTLSFIKFIDVFMFMTHKMTTCANHTKSTGKYWTPSTRNLVSAHFYLLNFRCLTDTFFYIYLLSISTSKPFYGIRWNRKIEENIKVLLINWDHQDHLNVVRAGKAFKYKEFSGHNMNSFTWFSNCDANN